MSKLLSCLFVFSSLTLFAQAQSPVKPPVKSGFEKMIQAILNSQLEKSASKPLSDEPIRLTGYALYVEGSLQDSIRYVYGGTRGTEIQPADPLSDYGFYRPDGPVVPFEIGNSAHDYMPYDSMFCYTEDPAGSLFVYTRYTKTYDSSDRLTGMVTKDYATGPAMNSYKFELIYDEAEGRISKINSWLDFASDLSGDYLEYSHGFLSYNTISQRTLDSFFYPGMSDYLYKNNYFYNAAGLPDSMIQVHSIGAEWPFYNHSRYNYSYDTLHRLIKAEEQFYDAMAAIWETRTEIYLGYTGFSELPTQRYVLSSGSWGAPLLPYSQTDAILLPGGFRYDSVYVKEDLTGTGVLENSYFYKNQYNSDNLLTSQQVYLWTGATLLAGGSSSGYSNIPQQIRYWNYSGTDPLSVPAPVQAVPVVFYPNPAKTHLIIEAKQTVSVSVYNLSGQLLLQQSGEPQNGALQLNIANLPAGNYLAEIQTEKGSSKVKFIKR